MLYEPRESINPRTFALRHVLLEELKLRLQRTTGDAARAPLVALARALDVSYDNHGRRFLVSGATGVSCEVPLGALRLYAPRVDAAAADWQRGDEILRANRALAAGLVDQLLSLPPHDATP
ncbi:MAG: hypothetical protein ACYC7F_08905 [Gemmatimonadaceae bacterium]